MFSDLNWDSTVFNAILSACIAIIVSAISGYFSYRDNRKGRIGEVISSNRVAWIQQLKSNVATFQNEVNKFELLIEEHRRKQINNNISISADYDFAASSLSQIFHALYTIKIHLNYEGKPDREILQVCQIIYNAEYYLLYQQNPVIGDEDVTVFDEIYLSDICCKDNLVQLIEPRQIEANVDDMSHAIKISFCLHLLTLLSQIYLKTEWERVKFEAKAGNIKGFDFNNQYNKRKRETHISQEIKFLVNILSLKDYIAI